MHGMPLPEFRTLLTTLISSLFLLLTACDTSQPSGASKVGSFVDSQAAPTSANTTQASRAPAAQDTHQRFPPRQSSNAAGPSPQPTTAPLGEVAAETREIVYYLASDELEGRGLGSHGLELAGNFVAARFNEMGLHPLPGQKDFFQPFDLTWADGIAADTTLGSGAVTYQLDSDYSVLSFSAEKAFDAPLVFVGYGITSPDHDYDDYSGINVKGKVVLAMRFEPVDPKGKSRLGDNNYSINASLETKARTAADHGAVALILMNPPRRLGSAALLPFARMFKGSAAALPVLHISNAVAHDLLGRGGIADPLAVADSMDNNFHSNSQPLPQVNIGGKVALHRITHTIRNVIGYLPGSGPHADEFVVVGAHYDHLGRGGYGSLLPMSHEIHSGADDDASGAAAMLEIARTLAGESPTRPPKRSVVFMAFTGEEEGLVGSRQFVEHPLVTLNKIVAMLNLDMVGRVRNNTLFVGGGGTARCFDGMLRDAAAGSPLRLSDMGRGGLGPSDHMSFAQKKIPVIFLFSGFHADYHRPTDKPDKINFPGLVDTIAVATRLVDEMTTMPHEQYVSAADASSMSLGTAPGTTRVMLGIIPNSVASVTAGVSIGGLVPLSPAAVAGLQEGDIITRLGPKQLENIQDMTEVLRDAQPGDKIVITFLRAGAELKATVTLAEKR